MFVSHETLALSIFFISSYKQGEWSIERSHDLPKVSHTLNEAARTGFLDVHLVKK